MSVFGILAVIFTMAFVVETLVEAVTKPLLELVPVLQKFKPGLIYLAMGVGIGGAFVYHFDIFVLLGQFMGVVIIDDPLGKVLTGFVIGMGASYFHALVKRFFVKEPLA